MKNTERHVDLGDQIKDGVTGFEGIVTAISEYLNGCRRVCVTPPAEGGKYQDERWIDEPQLTVLKRAAYLPPIRGAGITGQEGGDRPDCPPRR